MQKVSAASKQNQAADSGLCNVAPHINRLRRKNRARILQLNVSPRRREGEQKEEMKKIYRTVLYCKRSNRANQENHARFSIAYISLQNTARTVVDSVSHVKGERNLRTLILQYESATHRRLPSNRRVQYTVAYPAKGECFSRTHIL